jgi:hypothetical protein
LQGKEQYDPTIAHDDKIFFKDSCVIFEMGSVFNYTDPNKKISSTYSIERYIYLNLKDMVFYEYKTLSDTATLQRRFTTKPDSLNMTWKFYQPSQQADSLESLRILPDTIVSGDLFKRFQGSKVYKIKEEKKTVFITYFLLCNSDNSIFHIDKVFDESKKPCYSPRVDFYPEGQEKIYSSFYKVIQNNLSDSIRKIFDKWSENAHKTKLPIEEGWQFYDHSFDSITEVPKN